jgi:hypothetical protein
MPVARASSYGAERLIERRWSLLRLHILEASGDNETPCVVLPLDQLFENPRRGCGVALARARPAARPATRRERRCWHCAHSTAGSTRRATVTSPRLSSARVPCRSAAGKPTTFAIGPCGWRAWGNAMMQVGYRRLLLYPFRARA